MSFFHKFQNTNKLRYLNKWIQVILFLSSIAGINYLGIHYFIRADLTENHNYSLSSETKAYLNQLQDPIRIIVTIPNNSPREEERILFKHVSSLLREYQYFTQKNDQAKIELEFVDIYKDLAKAEQLSREIGLDHTNAIVVQSEDKTQFIRPDEILSFSNGKPTTFKGEGLVTSAIIEVSRKEPSIIYFLSGHGEMRPDSTARIMGISQLSTELRLRNFQIRSLDLNKVETIPADCDLLIIADPQGPLLPAELEKIRHFMSTDAGRLIAWLGPAKNHGLESLFLEWGIRTDERIILENNANYVESSGSILIRNFAPHPITESLIANQTYILSGLPRPIIPLESTSIDERLVISPLIASSAASWAESNWQSENDPTFNSGVDLQGPIPIGVIGERKASSQLGIKVPGGRIALFGSNDLFTNERLSSLGNNTLIFNTLNWILDREFLLSIPPRKLESYTLVASKEQLRLIALLFLAIPGTIGILGLTIFWVRKI